MKFLNYDGVATLWAKIKAYIIGATDTSKVIDGDFGDIVDIADTVTPLERYRNGTMGTTAHGQYREYRFSAEGIKKLVVRVGCAKGAPTNGITFVVFNDGTTNTAAPGARYESTPSTTAATYYNAVLDIPEGTKNIYVSNRPSAVSSPYIRAIYKEPSEGVTSDIYSMEEPYVADTKNGNYSTGLSISKDRTINTQTSSVALYRVHIVNIAAMGITPGTKLIVRAVFNRETAPLEPRVGFSVTQPAAGDTLMEEGFYEFLGCYTPEFMDYKRIITVPEGANYMAAYGYYNSDAVPCYIQVAKMSEPIEERASILESKTTFMYSGVLAQGKKLRFPRGATGKATFWNTYPDDAACGTIREILIGFDIDGGAQGGAAGMYSVLRSAAIDSGIAPDEAVSFSIVNDCVVASAIDGESYYTVFSTIEPEVI